MKFWMLSGIILSSVTSHAQFVVTNLARVENASEKTLTVDFGEGDPKPRKATLEKMIALGPLGTTEVKLTSIEKSCEQPCADEGEPTCHYVGKYSSIQPIKSLCEKLIVFSSKEKLGPVKQLKFEPAKESVREIVTKWSTRTYQIPIDSPTYRYRLQIDAKQPDQVLLFQQYEDGPESKKYLDGGEPQKFPLSKCKVSRHSVFTLLACEAIHVLYDGNQLVLVSMEDYGAANIEVLSSIDINGVTYFLIEQGLKGKTGRGLLYKEGGRWKLILGAPDYPTMC